MSKQKLSAIHVTMIRLPRPIYERLIRLSANRTIREGKVISVNRVILDAVEKSLAKPERETAQVA